MQEGIVFGTYGQLGGIRASKEFRSQNWWMAMASKPAGRGELRLSLMLSLEPLTVGPKGYAALFQTGESYKGRANVDRQHPHDFLMQASVGWRVPLGSRGSFTIAAAPVGEATVGPVAFMHRRSAADNPIVPISHHTFDASHVTMGVVASALTLGPLAVEGSVFRGLEPDDNRWDLDLGPLDSYAVRLWFHRGPFAAQVSHAFMKTPERLERLDVHKSTASISWTAGRGENYTAAMFAVGQNRRLYSQPIALVAEAAHRWGSRNALYTRVERVEVESEQLIFPLVVHIPHPQELIDPVTATTVGFLREVTQFRGFPIGVGASLTFYRAPHVLKIAYGSPESLHLFFRIRSPAARGRMPDTTMLAPMGHGR
jgi:hypothetical protein